MWIITVGKTRTSFLCSTKRNLVSTKLLYLNYNQVKKCELSKLQNYNELFRDVFIGDGTTVGKKLIFNILATGVFCWVSCCEIVDYTQKSAEYLAKLLIHILKKLIYNYDNYYFLLVPYYYYYILPFETSNM